jgi:hypothetical protein
VNIFAANVNIFLARPNTLAKPVKIFHCLPAYEYIHGTCAYIPWPCQYLSKAWEFILALPIHYQGL